MTKEDLAQYIDWCHRIMEVTHTPDERGFCNICCIRSPCEQEELAEVVLWLAEERTRLIEELAVLKATPEPERWGIEYRDTGVVVGMTFSTPDKAQEWIDVALRSSPVGWHVVGLTHGSGEWVPV